MEQTERFSAGPFFLSVAAAQLGRAILSSGGAGSVRGQVVGQLAAAGALTLLGALAQANWARLNRPGPAAGVLRAVFLVWYLVELGRTAQMVQQVCWQQFASMAFPGLVPLLLWAGWSLDCGLLDRMAPVLGWLLGAGALLALAGLTGQFRWQGLVPDSGLWGLPEVSLYPEYFSFPFLLKPQNRTARHPKMLLLLPVVSAGISAGYALGLALLFGAGQAEGAPGYPGCELLRAWSFGGISRLDAAFLLLWLGAALYRFCFLVRVIRLLGRLPDGGRACP